LITSVLFNFILAMYLSPFEIHYVCQWFVTGQWFSLVSTTNKTDRTIKL
jgi:hypothetical protein